MAVRIGSNISSLQAQRRLSEASSNLSRTLERLSSGQRINRASDDAAGLSIASSLNVQRRVYTQGVRNLNDGISALQIADSAVENLSLIVARIRELAEQASSGGFSAAQRKALDEEAQTLQDEYFRISRETSFNRMRLFDGSLQGGLRLQAGFGIDGSIQSSLGGVMGDGTFGTKTSYAAGNGPNSVTLGDLNGDGVLDMVAANYTDGTASVLIGKGDGTFEAKTSISVGGNPNFVSLGDVNGDGRLDMAIANYGGGTIDVLIGKGDGTFYTKTSYLPDSSPRCMALGDVNGDGMLDMVAANYAAGTASVFIGNGAGAFSLTANLTSGSGIGGVLSVVLGDINGDGALDIVTADCYSYDSTVSVFIGRGDGTYSARTSFGTGLSPASVALGDVNGDGKLDIVTADSAVAGLSVLIARGDGTFHPAVSYAAGSGPRSVALGDVNGDGVLDIVEGSGMDGTAGVFVGKGDGTFAARVSYAAGSDLRSVALGDLNGDGVLDLAAADNGGDSAGVLLGDTREGVAPLLPFSLATQADARQALAPLDRKIDQLSAQRGVIGAFQSRLSAALNTLENASENFAAAQSRIRDVDVAFESGELARLEIIQRAAAAILAQANQQPALVIKLVQ